MNVAERKKLFHKFLIKNDAVVEYGNAMIAKHGSRETAIAKMEELLESNNPQHCLTLAFAWENTTAGVDYWADLLENWLTKFK